MTPPFSVRSAPHYERLSDKLLRRHPEFEAISQWRLSTGRWRFRYNIYGQEVNLTYCGLRREETYR